MTICSKNEIGLTLKPLKRVKKRRRVTKKLERMKKGWKKSKHSASEKGRAVKGVLGRLAGFKAIPNTDDSNTTHTQEPELDS